MFRHVTKFQDTETSPTADWKLAALYDKYTEYADIVAAHGQLEVAAEYLDLLPASYPAAEVARNRVKLATKKAAPQASARQPASARPAARTVQAPLGYQPPNPLQSTSPLNTYPPPTQPQIPTPATNPYAPPASNQYQPPGPSPYALRLPPVILLPLGQAVVTGLPRPLGNLDPSPYGAPPRNLGPTPTPPPPRINKDVGTWNDVPIVARAPPRKTTPSVTASSSPFGGLAGPTSPPPMGGYGRSALDAAAASTEGICSPASKYRLASDRPTPRRAADSALLRCLQLCLACMRRLHGLELHPPTTPPPSSGWASSVQADTRRHRHRSNTISLRLPHL